LRIAKNFDTRLHSGETVESHFPLQQPLRSAPRLMHVTASMS
jgi:hypothetical protein